MVNSWAISMQQVINTIVYQVLFYNTTCSESLQNFPQLFQKVIKKYVIYCWGCTADMYANDALYTCDSGDL